MQNYLIYISYDGKNYAGYQVQKNADTVGKRILSALNSVFEKTEEVHGCSRTDSKVHAREFAVSFKSEKLLDENSVVKALNANLPDDISVKRCEYKSDCFHARYSVKKKEYIYCIYNGKVRDPFFKNYSLFWNKDIDISKLNLCAELFVGTHDFSAFKASGGKTEDCVRTVYSAYFEKKGDFVIFRISGNGFLYKMVRLIVGTLLSVSDGKLSAEDIKTLLNGKNQTPGFTAPPHGLFLNKVCYED